MLKQKLILKLIDLLKSRFIGFSVVGLTVFLIGISLLALQVEVLHINKIVAGISTTIISVEINFILNKYFNWRDRNGKCFEQWLKFHVARFGTSFLNQLIYAFLVALGLNYLFVSIALTVLNSLLNYSLNNNIVFRKE